MSRCVCTSMPPGMTSRPEASTTVWPVALRLSPTPAIFSPSIRTSVFFEPSALTTVPFLISVPILSGSCWLNVWIAGGGAFCDEASVYALLPRLGCQAGVDSLHGDAVGHRAHQRAQIATNALVFVDARNARKRREIRAGFACAVEIEFWDRRCADAATAFCGDHVGCAGSVRRRQRAIEVDALVSAVPASGVAEFAADALVFVNAGNDFVVEVEIL